MKQLLAHGDFVITIVNRLFIIDLLLLLTIESYHPMVNVKMLSVNEGLYYTRRSIWVEYFRIISSILSIHV